MGKVALQNGKVVQELKGTKSLQKRKKKSKKRARFEIPKSLTHISQSYQYAPNGTVLQRHGVSKNRKAIIDLRVKSKTVQTSQPGVRKYFTYGAGVYVLQGLENKYSCKITMEPCADVIVVPPEDCCDGLERLKAEAFLLPEFLAVDEECGVGIHTSEPEVRAVKYGILDEAVLMDGVDAQNSCEINMGGVTLQVCVGDITMEKVDAIITVNDCQLNLCSGGVLNSAISKLGGPLVKIECDLNMELHGPFEPGQVIMTSAGDLPTKHILHAVLCRHSANKSLVQDCVEQCLQFADTKGLTSISMPVIGTGILHMSPMDAADVIYSAFQNFAQMSPQNLRIIRVVVYHYSPSVSHSHFQQWLLEKHSNNLTSDEYSHLSDQSESLQSPGAGPEVNGIQRTRFPRKENVVNFHVLANHETSLTQAVHDLEGELTKACTNQIVKHEEICHLSADCWKRLLAHEITYNVSLDISNSCIQVSGGAQDVCNVVCKIWEEIAVTVKERQAGSNNELLSCYIQWVYTINGKEVPCSKKVNSLLECALGSRSEGVQFLIGDREYFADFHGMMVTFLGKRTASVPLLRKVLGQNGEDLLPRHWFPQPRTPTGAYVTSYLVMLSLDCRECHEVQQRFYESQRKENATILKIQRVQNPYLYESYAVRKRKMSSESNGNENEELLFHGTNDRSLAAINDQGFNRSFAGTHGALYGNGVYFARDSSCSLGYTSPGFNGERHMYLVRVLLGKFTRGRSGMKQPPPVDQRCPEKLYDSLVDNVLGPKIHVVFHDAQMYPEYLISFITH